MKKSNDSSIYYLVNDVCFLECITGNFSKCVFSRMDTRRFIKMSVNIMFNLLMQHTHSLF